MFFRLRLRSRPGTFPVGKRKMNQKMTTLMRSLVTITIVFVAGHGLAQSIFPRLSAEPTGVRHDSRDASHRELVLPYESDVQNHLVSAVVQADGSWLASGGADAALNITFEPHGAVRNIEHVRAPFITEFDYGFPVGSTWQRDTYRSLVHFDNLQNIDDTGVYDSGCRIRVAAPSRIDFYSAACGNLGITGANAYLWFRTNGVSSRLIRRMDDVELWNVRFYDIPEYGRFSGDGAIFSGDSALVYGISSLAGPIAMKIDRDGNTQWIQAIPSLGGIARGQFAAASFDPISQQFVFWLNEVEAADFSRPARESMLASRRSVRLIRLSQSGQVQRSNTTVSDPLRIIGTSALIFKALPARVELVDGALGGVLWSHFVLPLQNLKPDLVRTDIHAICHDSSAVYLSTSASSPEPNAVSITKLQIIDGLRVYQQTFIGSGSVQSLFCDQGQAFLQTAAFDEPRIAPVLTTLNAQGVVQWQVSFPPVPHEVADVRLVSNQGGDMVVELGLNQGNVSLPVRHQLSHRLVRGYTQNANRFEILGEPDFSGPTQQSRSTLGNDGYFTHVAITDTQNERFDYHFEQLDRRGNSAWRIESPYKSAMHVGYTLDSVAWFAPERATTEHPCLPACLGRAIGFPTYSITPQGVLRIDQLHGTGIGNWANVDGGIEAIMIEGATTNIVRLSAGARPSYELIPGFFSEARISYRGDAFTLSPQSSPNVTTLKKYDRSQHQFSWSYAAQVQLSNLSPDESGGVWAKAIGQESAFPTSLQESAGQSSDTRETRLLSGSRQLSLISAAHFNATGQLVSDPAFNSRITLEGQICQISELKAAGTGALGFGTIMGGGCVFWLDAHGVSMDGALLPGVFIRQIAHAKLQPEIINVLAQRQNTDGLFEVIVQAVQRNNFRDSFE
jgi:hypothetical protein